MSASFALPLPSGNAGTAAGVLATLTASVAVVVPSVPESSRHARAVMTEKRVEDVIRARGSDLIIRAR